MNFSLLTGTPHTPDGHSVAPQPLTLHLAPEVPHARLSQGPTASVAQFGARRSCARHWRSVSASHHASTGFSWQQQPCSSHTWPQTRPAGCLCPRARRWRSWGVHSNKERVWRAAPPSLVLALYRNESPGAAPAGRLRHRATHVITRPRASTATPARSGRRRRRARR